MLNGKTKQTGTFCHFGEIKAKGQMHNLTQWGWTLGQQISWTRFHIHGLRSIYYIPIIHRTASEVGNRCSCPSHFEYSISSCSFSLSCPCLTVICHYLSACCVPLCPWVFVNPLSVCGETRSTFFVSTHRLKCVLTVTVTGVIKCFLAQ